jgi:thiamine-phosphate pyrophosphorylase
VSTRPWAPPRLVAITDLSAAPQDQWIPRLTRLAHAACPGSIAFLLRDHAASAQQRLAFGHALREIARSSEQALWVADRLDLALLLEADAVHLGEGSVSATAARRLVGADMRISRAWHAASLDGPSATDELVEVDALLLSPVLEPRKGRPPLGLETLGVLGEQLLARHSACHLYALGGVAAKNAGACLAVGAAGVAAIGALLREDVQPLLGALGIAR